MINGKCPICNGFVTVTCFDPYDGYHGDLSIYRVGCKECKIFAEDSEQLIAERKWNVICGNNEETDRSKAINALDESLKLINYIRNNTFSWSTRLQKYKEDLTSDC